MGLSPRVVVERYPAMVARGLVLLSLLVFVVLITRVYRDLSPTWDEPSHIGNGIAWLNGPHRMIDPVDPPIGRISAAFFPWLDGATAVDLQEPYSAGNLVLKREGRYRRTATLARLGILPWYFVSVFMVWRMSRQWLGEWAAAFASVLFIFCPPVLANASIATTDMVFVTTFLVALDRLWAALQRPTAANCAVAGVCLGAACGAKLSGLPFGLLSVASLALVVWFYNRRRPRVSRVVVAALMMALTIWGVYRFEVGPLATNPDSHAQVERMASKAGPLKGLVVGVVEHVPAYQFFQGIRVARQFTKRPPPGYLFGESYTQGRSYFFVLILLVKSPIPLLILGFAGMWLASKGLFAGNDAFAVVPLTGFFVPMAVATASHVHLGVRHVLVVYASLAMLGAFAAHRLLRASKPSRWVVISALGVLVAWIVVDTVAAAPDFLAWYNEPAAPYAAFIHVDSDYDWGQDLYRLSAKLRELSVEDVWISYSGSTDLDQFGLPRWKVLPNDTPEKGWIAISETNFRLRPGDFGWLAAYKPVAVAGKTIRIYRID